MTQERIYRVEYDLERRRGITVTIAENIPA